MPQFEDPKNLTTNTYLTILPDAQQATINFVDTDNNRLLHQVIAWNGKTSSISTYDPQIAINGYLAQGYELVSNDFVKNFKYDNIDDGQGVVSQTFTIALKSSATTESKTITRIINYLDQQTQATVADSINQSVTFTRTSTTNGLTGEKNYTPWTAEGDTFAEVSSPDLTAKGYLAPDQPVVGSLKVTPDVNNIVVNVYYSKTTTTTPGNPGEPTQPATPPTEPRKPTTPTNPVVPETPENPVTPDTPENSQPETPQTENNQTSTSQNGAKVENNIIATAAKNVPVAKSDHNQAMVTTSTVTTLPHTSESSQSKTSLLGLIGLALTGFLGLNLKRRHD